MSLEQTASQTVGPFFYIGYGKHVITELDAGPQYPPIIIRGKIFDGAGAEIPDAVIETWQADPDGHYAHVDDPQARKSRLEFSGFMRALVDEKGEFTFTTVKPGRVAGPHGMAQAPHLMVNVLMRGVLKQASTRLYFSDETGANNEDPILALVPEARRHTLIAKQVGPHDYTWEIHMQGHAETVFFSF